uniref:Kinetochore protein Spc25 n=1 Tax=Drosophila lutescens TaxID=51159 RepID=SPC25_DROLT|nr:RecName: Full=Kinetochore protein Spc25 [Drosophila lutescens]AAU15008.1 Mitch [Drosophila lutescens]
MAKAVDESTYEQRVRALYDKQIRMEAREAGVIKKISKFNSNLLDLKEAVVRHHQKVGKVRKVKMLRCGELEKRANFMEELTQELEATKQRNLVMRDQIKQLNVLARQHRNEVMESIHTLSKTTGTYLNHEALPARVKGVTVLRNDNSDQLIPFDLKATDVEGLESLCQHLQGFNIDAFQWRQLVSLATEMSMDSHTTPTTPPKEAAEGKSIIEIDLTSPTSHI